MAAIWLVPFLGLYTLSVSVSLSLCLSLSVSLSVFLSLYTFYFSMSVTHVTLTITRSLTPEKLATGIASRFPPGTRIVDTTCGAGGNSIAFARSGCNVVAIERDATRLAMAKHNAKVYGVASRIDFRCGDCLALLPHLTRGQEGDEKAAAIDVLFVDPPWGEHWNRTRTTLSDLPLLDKLVQRLTTTTSTCADVAVAGGSIDYKALGDSSEEKANAKKKTESPRFKRLLAKVPPSFDPSTIPGSQVEAMFGHQEGDYHRVKFLLLGVDLVRDL